MPNDALESWNDSSAKPTIVDFVTDVTRKGSPKFVPVESRVAVFDNDGTLWCEKPMAVELGFILQRLAAMAERDESLRLRQPWKAAYSKGYAWMGEVITKNYHGDDSDVKTLIGGILRAFEGMTVDEYELAAFDLLEHESHPTLKRSFRDCAYRPMIELLRYLRANSGSRARSRPRERGGA
jgi:hypothetical protein